MDELIRDFENKMHLEGKSEKTIKIYVASVKEFFRWFNDSFGDVEFKKLYRENILEYKSYLKNVKNCKRTGQNLNAKEVSDLFGIGQHRLREIVREDYGNKYHLMSGRTIKIKRKQFGEFIDNVEQI